MNNSNSKEILTGTITSFFEKNGYGFIETQDGKSYFLHITNCIEKVVPEIGQTIEFRVGTYDGRPVAIQI